MKKTASKRQPRQVVGLLKEKAKPSPAKKTQSRRERVKPVRKIAQAVKMAKAKKPQKPKRTVKKRVPSARSRVVQPELPVWVPTMPLANVQHETFALRYAQGIYSAKSAYLQAYGETTSGESAAVSACRLLTDANIRARVDHLRELATQEVVAEMNEVVRFCLNIIRTPVGYVDDESPLAQEVQREIAGTQEEGPVLKMRVKMPAKLDAAKLLADLKGWKKVEEVNLNVNYTRPDEAAQAAQAAGMDVKALLAKLLKKPA